MTKLKEGKSALSSGVSIALIVIVVIAILFAGELGFNFGQSGALASASGSTVTTTATTTVNSSSKNGWISSVPPPAGNTTVSVTLVAGPAKTQIANNVTYDGWSFNGTIPGPTIWVYQGQKVLFTLINNDTMMGHSIDFHAAQVNWATDYATIAPGARKMFNFTVDYPGIFMYHCGTAPVLEHISNGMYGVIIVQPTGANALPRATGGQYVLIESEFYLNSNVNPDGSYSGNYTKMLRATPDYVVFNGKAFQYMSAPLEVKPNQLVRLYIFNEGPSLWEAFHVIGGIMDTVYIDGNPANPMYGLQTVNIPPAGGVIVDMYFTDPGGKNPFVNHAFAYASIGAVGVFQVSNDSSSSASVTTTTTTTSLNTAGSKVSILSGSAANMNSPGYSPSKITVVIGVNNTVTWTNDDSAPHTVTALDKSFDSGNMNSGDSFTWTFTTPGTYNYRCSYHPWMNGTVVVLPSG